MANDFLALATKGVQGLKPYQPGKPIDELERELGISNIIKLASNENPLGPSPLAIQVINKNITGLSRYPDGNGFSLRAKLAGQLNVNADQITLGNGSNDILELIGRAFLLPEHEVIFSRHSFAVYPLVTQASGATAVVTAAKYWGNDLQAMLDAITKKTRVIFLANPNNPTGTWLDKTSLLNFLKKLPDNVILVLDEAYFEYVTDPDYPNGLTFLNEYKNLIVTRTFSKAYGLAGLRVGYGISCNSIADILNRVRQPFNVNSIALAAAEAALDDVEFIKKSRSMNKLGMQQLIQAFDEMGLKYIPSVANFIAVNVGRDANSVYKKLLHKGVIVRPVENYDMPGFLRITIGTKEENEKFISSLKETISELTTSTDV
jgi:histidinol-phosphate aminotransferase